MMRRRSIKIACGLLVAVVVIGAFVPAITIGTRSPKTCTLCRAERIDLTCFGYAWQRYRDTEFTEWYSAHRPAHQHQWGRLSCTRGVSIVGTTTFFACGPRHPICDIPPNTLKQFAEHADMNTLDTFFDGVTSNNRDSQRQAVDLAWDRALRSK